MKCPCNSSRIVCFLFHGQPTPLWWLAFLAAVAAEILVLSLLS